MTNKSKRYGIYFAPAPNSEMWALGSSWLGRDCLTGKVIEIPNVAELAQKVHQSCTQSPRRYGFHATLKPPFRLADGKSLAQLERELSAFAQRQHAVKIGQMKLKAIGRFLALVPSEQSDELSDFAAKTVETFDPFRAPLSAERREKRMAAGLSPRQIELLDLWGYPYVMDQFRMHMTLSDPLDENTGPLMLNGAKKFFAPVLAKSHILDRICLYEEAAPGVPFSRMADFELQRR